MASAWSLFRSIGNAIGAFPAYAAKSNMEYALYRAYGPDWEERVRQQQQDQEMSSQLDKAQLDNRRQQIETERWRTAETEQKAIGEALENAAATGGRTTGKYTPAEIGKPGTARFKDLGELSWEEAERKRLAKERFEREKNSAVIGQREKEAEAETARKRQYDVGRLGIEKYKTTPEYLGKRYEDMTDYERRAAAEAKHATTPKAKAPRESVTEVVARKLAMANQILLENPDLDQPRQLDPESGEKSEYYEQTGRPIPYKKWDAVPYNVQQEVERRLSRQTEYPLEGDEEAATPAPEKEVPTTAAPSEGQKTYRIPVGLKMKIDAGMELTPEEIEFLRSLRQ